MYGTKNKEKQINDGAQNPEPKKKKRIFYLDQVRALAIILVVLTHICNRFMATHPDGSIGWIIPTSVKVFCAMAVPLFLMISGSLLLNRDYELKDYLSRRFVRLILPVIFWGFFLIILNQLAGYPYLARKPGMMVNVLWFFSDAYWFSWMLISVYLFVPLVNSFIKKYQFAGVEYFLVIWFIYLVLFSYRIHPLYQFDLTYFGGYMGFLVLGYYLHNKEFNISDKSMYLIGILIFLISSAIYYYMRVICLYDGGLTYRLGLLAAFQGIGAFIFFKYFAKYSETNLESISNKVYSFFKDTIIGKLTFSISICSYGIYLCHYYFLHIGFVAFAKDVFSANPIKGMALVFVVVFTLAWILVLLVSKIPHMRKWTGIG